MANYEVLPHSHGYTSTIYRLPGDPPRVCKSFNPDCTATHFPIEQQVYERFAAAGDSKPTSILRYYGVHPTIPAGLVLEHAQNFNAWDYLHVLKDSGSPLPNAERLLQWAEQAVEALVFAHGLGIFNADVHPVNIFLDQELNLKVGDWAGASVDGGQSCSMYRVRYQLCRFDGEGKAKKAGVSIETECFAFGSALFYLGTGQEIWPQLEEPRDKEEIRRRIAAREWPDVSGMAALGDLVVSCWEVRFESMNEVKAAVRTERRSRSLRPEIS